MAYISVRVILLFLLVDWSNSLNEDDQSKIANEEHHSFTKQFFRRNQEAIQIIPAPKLDEYLQLPIPFESTYCNPEAPPDCIHEKFGICLDDDEYPEEEIKEGIQLSDLANQYSYKVLDKEQQDQLANGKNTDSGECKSISIVIKPIRAPNIDGYWRVIVQDAYDIFQRERATICLDPDTICTAEKLLSPVACYNSRCNQQYIVRRLLAFDPCNPKRGLFVDSFKLPSACTCRLSRMPC